MNILIVEDDDFKLKKIERLINSFIVEASITHFDNVCQTVRYLKENIPDKIVLDMSLPSHQAKIGEGSPVSMPSGGIEIILHLRRMKKLSIPIIILTQYPDIEIEGDYYSMEESREKIKELYGVQNLIVSAYDNDLDGWKESTKEFLRG